MARKRILHNRIITLLQRYGPLWFTKIKEQYKVEFNKKIAPNNLVDNLTFLVSQERVERKTDTKGRVIYSLTKSHYESTMKRVVQEIIGKTKRLYKIGEEIQAICLDDRDNIPQHRLLPSTLTKQIELLTFLRLEAEIHADLFYKKGTLANLVEEVSARTLWTGFLLEEEQRSRDTNLLKARIGMEKQGWIKPPYSEINNLADVMEQVHQPSGPHWEKVRNEWTYAMYVRDVFASVTKSLGTLDKLNDAHWVMLGYFVTQYAYAYNKTDEINGTKEENLKFLEKNKDVFDKVLQKIRETKFILVIPYGCKEIESAQVKRLVDDFEGWRAALIIGRLDHRAWIFNEGAKNVKKFIFRMKKPKFKGAQIPHVLPNLLIDPPFYTMDIYNIVPEARAHMFWEDLLKNIQERRTKRIRSS